MCRNINAVVYFISHYCPSRNHGSVACAADRLDLFDCVLRRRVLFDFGAACFSAAHAGFGSSFPTRFSLSGRMEENGFQLSIVDVVCLLSRSFSRLHDSGACTSPLPTHVAGTKRGPGECRNPYLRHRTSCTISVAPDLCTKRHFRTHFLFRGLT